jgi:hypothetical protein
VGGSSVRKRIRLVSLTGTLLTILFITVFGFRAAHHSMAAFQNEAHPYRVDVVEEMFQVELQGFRSYTFSELIDRSVEEPELLSLLASVSSICVKGCEEEPIVFMKLNKGYVVYEQAGEAKLLQMHLSNDGWEEQK